MSISLSRLEITNFRSFEGTHSLDFHSSGLCLIRGTNEDTGSENGSGKSSILLAIGYLTGAAPFSAKDMKSWLNDEHMSVKGTFSTPDGPMIITRGTKKLELEFKGNTTIGKDVEKQIDQIFGIDAAMRSVLTYRPQGEVGFFLSLSDSDKKSFLVKLLGLDMYEALIDKSTDTIKILQSKLNELSGQLTSYQNMYDDCVKNLQSAPDVDEFESKIKDLTARLAVEESNLKSAKSSRDEIHRKRKEELEEFRSRFERSISLVNVNIDKLSKSAIDPADLEDVSSKFNEASKRLDALKATDKASEQSVASECQRLATQARHAQEKIESLEKEKLNSSAMLKDLENGKCYTCQQGYPDSEEKAATIRINMLTFNKEIVDLVLLIASCNRTKPTFTPNPLIEKLKAARDKLYAEKTAKEIDSAAALERSLAPLREEIGRYRTQSAAMSKEIEDKYDSLIGSVNASYDNATQAFLHTDNELSKIKNSYKALQDAYSSSQKRMKSAEETLEKHKTSFVRLSSELNAELDFLDLLKGFIDRIFSDILQQITDEANQMIGSLPNVSHLTLEFRTEKQTLKGTVKQSITPVVLFKGTERPLKSGCSGGMYKSVELAVDWSLFKVISERTGAKLNWLSIDEGFDGLDKNNKEACLEILQKVAGDRLILVVDHSSETKELFSQTINVLYKNERSCIVAEQ